MEKEKKLALKQKAKEIAKQNYDFKVRANALFDKKFKASEKYEDSVVKEDGKAHINVDLTKVKTPFSIYSYDKRMDSEIFDYIDDQVYFLRAAIPVVINFDDGGKYSDELKEKIRYCVTRHYTLQYEDKRLEHYRILFNGFITLLIGILILVSYITLSTTILKDKQIFIEIFCILSWVCVWNAVDMFFISGHERRVDIYNSAQLALAEITFTKTPK